MTMCLSTHYLGSFQCWAVMNKDAMKKLGTSIWVDLFMSLGKHLAEFPGCRVSGQLNL